MSADRITLLAPAKTNLFLAVGQRRPDGYHDLLTVFQALDAAVSDQVEITVADSLSVVCTPDIGVRAEDNLVYRALVGLGHMVGRAPRFSVAITKNIPAAGGLGGASTDAAAALVGACRLWGLDAMAPEVLDLAASLGADVPFFIHGGTALYGGRGDTLLRRLRTPSLHLAVVNPGVPSSTAAAYAAFDRRLPLPVPDVAGLLDAIDRDDATAISASLFNNLSDAARDTAPEVGDAFSFVSRFVGVLGAVVSGSGSSVIGICEDAQTAERVAGAAEERDGWWGRATSASSEGIASAL